MPGFDYDVVIIGSGFGGSVAALRAAENGERVGVMEAGRRWKDEDIPKILRVRHWTEDVEVPMQGIPAPDGAYSQFLLPIIGVVWVVVVRRVLLTRSPATRTGR